MTEPTAAALSAPTRIGIVEDHPRYREALQATIEAMDDIVVAWVVADSTEAMRKCAEDPVDVAIVDVSIPGESGITLIGRIRAEWPSTACVVLSGHTERRYVRRSFESGAIAYVVKGRPSELREGIAAGRSGERYLSAELR